MFIHFCSFYSLYNPSSITLIYNSFFIKFLKGGDVGGAVPQQFPWVARLSRLRCFPLHFGVRLFKGAPSLCHLSLYRRRLHPCFLHAATGSREIDTALFPRRVSSLSAWRSRPSGRVAPALCHLVPTRFHYIKEAHPCAVKSS